MADPTRLIAFDLLDAVLSRRRTLDDALEAVAAEPRNGTAAEPRNGTAAEPRSGTAAEPRGGTATERRGGISAEPRDRAAAHRIAACVLRRLGSLDAVLEPHLRREPPAPARLALRIGAAQLLLLGTPPHAAVATSVALARLRAGAPFAGLVNAVLRRVAADGPASLAGLDGPRLDTPGWLWSSWGGRARAIAEAHAAEAPLDLTLRQGRDAGPLLALPGAMRRETGSVRLPGGEHIPALPGYAEGDFWVQDEAASLPARLLRAGPGMRVADLCAAPGGKSLQLAGTGAEVFAVERDRDRLARLRENAARTSLPVRVVEADALCWQPPEPLDAVLLDAPCTATGTIRRHPDILRLRHRTDAARLARSQAALVASAARMLRPGGCLVYAVCSLQREEAEAAFGIDGLALDLIAPEELPTGLAADGVLRTDPGMGMDGFFAARFRRI